MKNQWQLVSQDGKSRLAIFFSFPCYHCIIYWIVFAYLLCESSQKSFFFFLFLQGRTQEGLFSGLRPVYQSTTASIRLHNKPPPRLFGLKQQAFSLILTSQQGGLYSAGLGCAWLGSSGSGCSPAILGSRLQTGLQACIFILELRPNGQQLPGESSSLGGGLTQKEQPERTVSFQASVTSHPLILQPNSKLRGKRYIPSTMRPQQAR